MFGSVRYSLTSVQVRSRIKIESISEVMRTARLHYLGRVERKDEEDWVKCVKHFEMEGRVPVCSPSKTWDEALRKNLENKGTDRQGVS